MVKKLTEKNNIIVWEQGGYFVVVKDRDRGKRGGGGGGRGKGGGKGEFSEARGHVNLGKM